MSNTVEKIKKKNMCISCGICAPVCPTKCISYNREGGLFVPEINKEKCIECGICLDVCPGKKSREYAGKPEEVWNGQCLGAYSACTNNKNRLRNAVSGGIATELVFKLLEENKYDGAFVVTDNLYYESMAESNIVLNGVSLDNSQKSKYLPVMHSKAIEYLLKNREKRIILIGVSCAVQGFLNVIDRFKLNRDNYFIIGLFCDRTMNMNVMEYFSNTLCPKTDVAAFHFRSKESGGWPGGIKIIKNNQDKMFFSNKKRMEVKDFFQPERCLYCIDKLNKFADISIGDNYTNKFETGEGSSSVIIRSKRAEEIWNNYSHCFSMQCSSLKEISNSQCSENKIRNYYYGKIKEKELDWKINNIKLEKPGKEYLKKINNEYRKRMKLLCYGKYYSDNKGKIRTIVFLHNLENIVRAGGKYLLKKLGIR